MKKIPLNTYKCKKKANNSDVPLKDEETTISKSLGSVVHASLIETEEFENNKDFYMNQLKPEDQKRFFNVRKSFYENPKIKKIVDTTDLFEKVCTWKTPVIYDKKTANVFCKMKFDILTRDEWVVDLKTINRLSPQKIKWNVNQYRYDIQAAFYMDGFHTLGLEPRGFIFVFLETNPPYENTLFYAGKSLLERGRHGDHQFRGFESILPEIHFNPRRSKWEPIQELKV